MNLAIIFLISMHGPLNLGKHSTGCVEILNKMYRNDINGLGGNDDCGQMSACIFLRNGFRHPVYPEQTSMHWEPRIALSSSKLPMAIHGNQSTGASDKMLAFSL